MLDTNICIYIAKRQPPEVIGRFAKYRRGEIAISAITWGELFCGTVKDGAAAINGLLELLEVVPFCRKAAEHYALLTMQHPNRKANFDQIARQAPSFKAGKDSADGAYQRGVWCSINDRIYCQACNVYKPTNTN